MFSSVKYASPIAASNAMSQTDAPRVRMALWTPRNRMPLTAVQQSRLLKGEMSDNTELCCALQKENVIKLVAAKLHRKHNKTDEGNMQCMCDSVLSCSGMLTARASLQVANKQAKELFLIAKDSQHSSVRHKEQCSCSLSSSNAHIATVVGNCRSQPHKEGVKDQVCKRARTRMPAHICCHYQFALIRALSLCSSCIAT